MKEIECPSCGEMIPEDSKFCDMCGVELLECINCHTLGTDNFCPECGSPMVARNQHDEATQENKPTEDIIEVHVTVGKRQKPLILKSRESNVTLQPENDAIIGRSNSPYASVLSDFNHISRRHGKFQRRGQDWYIVDFGSTNGTYVNNVEVPANTPVKIAAGDVVDIGTYIFDVLEK